MTTVTTLAEHPVIRDLSDFDRRSGSLVERLLFNNRWVVLFFCAFFTIIAVYQGFGLRLQASFEKMIPLSHPYIANFQKHKSELAGLGNTLRFAVETSGESIFDAKYLEVLRQLNDELFLLPGVDRPFVKSLWTPATRWLGVTEEGLDGGPVIPDNYDGSASSVEQVRINVERSGEIGQLVAPNFKSSMIVVPLLEKNAETGQKIDYHDLSVRIERLRDRYESRGVHLHIVGFAKVVGDLIDGLEQILKFFLFAVIICTAVLFWYTRCVRSTFLVVTCSIVAVVWLLGALPALGIELDPYSILVPFLVFAIGMSHGAQKMNGIMQDVGRGTHRLIAARYTFRRLFLAGLTALLADAVGFAVLLTIDIRAIQDLAVTASIGVAVLIITNLILLPIFLSFTGVSPAAARRSLQLDISDESDKGAKKHPFFAFLNSFTEKKGAYVAITGSVVLAIAGLIVSSQLRIGDMDAGAPELRPDSRYNRDSAYVVANYAASSDVYVIMVTTPQYQCAQYSTLVKVDALEERLQQLPGVESTNSFASLSKRSVVGMNEGSWKWYELSRTQDILNAVATRAPRELFNQECDMLAVYAYLKDHRADTLTSVVQAVEAFAAENNTEQVHFLSAAGNAGIEAATNIVVKGANAQMLILVYLAVSLLAFIALRSWKAVICAVLPLVLTSILCEALMVALGIGVKVATLPVIALGVGIGVDYALYILTVTLARLRSGMSLSDAYYKALTFTGRVVALTGITLGLAVSTWAFSPIKFQADMGILLGFMFIWNMLGAGILLPALAYIFFGSSSKTQVLSR